MCLFFFNVTNLFKICFSTLFYIFLLVFIVQILPGYKYKRIVQRTNIKVNLKQHAISRVHICQVLFCFNYIFNMYILRDYNTY